MAAMVADLPVVFVYAGGSYTGTPTELNDRDTLTEGGFDPQDTLFLSVPLQVLAHGTYAAQFATEPVPGKALVIAGTAWRVVSALRSQDGVAVTLGLRR